MLRGNKYISKALSSILLAVLLLIHSVRLLHSHPNNSICSKETHSSSVAKNSSDCSICSYQLAKDASAEVYFPQKMQFNYQTSFDLRLSISYKTAFNSVFESRGPPSGI